MRRLCIAAIILIAVAACSPGSGKRSTIPAHAESIQQVSPPLPYEAALPEELRPKISEVFKGDLDAMEQRRIIRIGAPFNRTYYFLDGAVPRGLSYEYAKLYEQKLNGRLGKDHPFVHVVLLPFPRDQLLPALNAGKIDMVIAQLTITPERSRIVDFTVPTRKNVSEILVTGPGSSAVSSLDALSGKTVLVRRSSSYFQSLQAVNAGLKHKHRQPVTIREAPENLEDDDLLEMVNAGLIPGTVVDDYLADFWKKVFPNLVLSSAAPLHTGGNLAAAIRKNSPKLAASLNEFITANGLNTALGATLNRRYLDNTTYVKAAAASSERAKFLSTVDLFRRYGTQYDFDYLLMAAQGYQESRLDQNAKSQVGAIGVMQLMPATGEEEKVGDIHTVEPNIHAGVKYMRFMLDTYYAREPMNRLNKELFTFASYNAGPGRIRQLRREAAARGLNPNVWFGNVEQIAAERIGSETVTYVGNIFKYYVAYRLITEERQKRERAKQVLMSENGSSR